MIVVDDAYSESLDVSSLLVNGVRVIRNEQNLGFLRSCNKVWHRRGAITFAPQQRHIGAPRCAGRAQYFEDHESAERLRSLRCEDDSFGRPVGSYGRDGSAWNWGAARTRDPRFLLREVDYGSAAALMVERALRERIGGFDDLLRGTSGH